MRKTAASLRITAVLSAAVLALGACGSDGGSEADADPAADLDGTPIKVGFLNPSGGPVPQPGADTGAEAAVDYINGELGGINGGPLEVISCDTDTTPEKAQSCANTFVEEGVVAVMDGFNLSSSATLPTLTAAKIPLVGMIPFDSVAGSKAENRVFFAAPQASFLVGAMQAFKEQGKDSVTLALVDTPSSHQTIDTLLPALAGALQMDAKGVYFSPTNPNFTALAATIAKDDPAVGGLVASPNEGACTALVQALRQQQYDGTIFTAACTDYIEAAPAEAAGGALYSSTWLPASLDHAPEDVKSDLEAAEKAITGVEDGSGGYYAYGEFAQFVTFAKALDGVEGEITGEAVLTTLKGLKDFPSFLGPNITCGSATSPNCTTEMLLFDVEKDGTIAPVGEGFRQPPLEILSQIPGAT
ncbi:ABC transporter substrate-binding protein [Mumia sp. ZJ1417]|uniref:ABC transporter substrate-binding protein n=1 Tax=Mumia sp. ZJ1417 TaxID=2708082 RepID=UPI00142387C1|nr:ABC transporter substrate-binding protein [Mumia sp. ZJ1417]QMW66951.1 ABC transporter substrate-binding protein [Mumia sp. ZJ1417]